MKILLLGSQGQIGRCLSDQLINTKHQVFYSSRSDLDITNLKLTLEYISSLNPDVIINTAAYTAVDAAEENKTDVNILNNIAVSNIAKICNESNCLLVHYSSDYIFDGMSDLPYVESSNTNPLSIYGKSKLDSEIAIKSSNCKFLIIRTGWVYSEYGNNFMKTMIQLADNSNEINVVADQFGCPTYAQDIAKATIIMIDKVENDEKYLGIYNYCGDTSCTWYDFCVSIFREAAEYNFSIPSNINPISTDEYPTLAERPKYSVLNCNKIMVNFNILPSSMEAGILNTLEAIK